MAPILAAEIGITPQIIDDSRLVKLRNDLAAIELRTELGKEYSNQEDVEVPLDIAKLIDLLDPWQTWEFEEQVDLNEWTRPLNVIDACLSFYIQKYPSILLIGPVKRTNSRGSSTAVKQFVSKPAESVEEIQSIPLGVTENLVVLLRFLIALLSNSCNKTAFNSVEELVDLLAAADDSLVTYALEALCAVANPPALHKQQVPEIQQHTSALHASKTESHRRLVAMAKGWGSKASGLGLYTCASTDDSEFGQGSLPKEGGEVRFSFLKPGNETNENQANNDGSVVEIFLERREMIKSSSGPTNTSNEIFENDESSTNKQKRRRVAPLVLGEETLRSTAELFFYGLEKLGGRHQIPEGAIFSLLCDIRLARAFHSHATRIVALQRRLRALITILYSHPSQEVMTGYFQAQPELCVELTDMLRPTVSSASVSAASSKTVLDGKTTSKNNAILALATSPSIPYDLRELALQTLTALVGRRDGTTGALAGVARHSNVLNELGVGKGQHLGLLPTLLRFSLASLSAILKVDDQQHRPSMDTDDLEGNDVAMQIGLAFIEASRAHQLPKSIHLYKALSFVDSVLTLTSAVVSTQSGTTALTECGLIPALLTTITIDIDSVLKSSGLGSINDKTSETIKALFRFVAAQAVQIIEGTIVTQNNALSAFHELCGVEVLTQRLSADIFSICPDQAVAHDATENEMDCDEKLSGESLALSKRSSIRSSQRVLLFSIVTCLTVVFHQESTSSHVTMPSGAAELRKPELTKAIIMALQRLETFGGHLISLIATLLADVMNSDPHIVRHVHESGIAEAFLSYFVQSGDAAPRLPPVPELIMAVPSVISALALTEDGAQIVEKANPFPVLLQMFYHPKYAMPQSRCLLNEMLSIIGSGLDEIMRHTARLKPMICSSIATALERVASIGESLVKKEKTIHAKDMPKSGLPTSIENERTCLMQYALNFGQLLEQVLHNEDHCGPFVAAGGLSGLLRLYPSLIPTGVEFLSHVSCLSCPSVSTLSHSATEGSISLALRCIAQRHDSNDLLKVFMDATSKHLDKLEDIQQSIKKALANTSQPTGTHDHSFVLDFFPAKQFYDLLTNSSDLDISFMISDFLRQLVTVQWIISLLSIGIKTLCQRSQEAGGGWSRQEKQWKKELSSASFGQLFHRLSHFQQSAVFEACRIRASDGFDSQEKMRLEAQANKRLLYRLRIVCPEGAVVRDGIEIDSCASVGNMEMGEIAIAFDRCVNSSGVMRYKTYRGWVSEQTRGHGREPIAEVLGVWEDKDARLDELTEKGRIECCVPDIRTTSAHILARLQTSYSDLFSAISKMVIQDVHWLSLRSISFKQGDLGHHISTLLRMMKSEIQRGFHVNNIDRAIGQKECGTSALSSCISLYLGCLLEHIRASLFDEKRDRHTVNVPLLLALSTCNAEEVGLFDSMRFVICNALQEYKELYQQEEKQTNTDLKFDPPRRQSRATAGSFPVVVALMNRLSTGKAITTSPTSSVLSRVKEQEIPFLLGEKKWSENTDISNDGNTFSPEKFARELLCTLSGLVNSVWTDKRLHCIPAFAAHPFLNAILDLVSNLEDSTKKATVRGERNESWLSNAFRGFVANRAEASGSSDADNVFEPSEEAVSRLMEMGFSRDHAWASIDATGSNQLEVAMEHALSHPAPSAREVERRRASLRARGLGQEPRQRDSSLSNEDTNQDGNMSDRVEPSQAEAMEVDPSHSTSDEKMLDDSLSKAKTYFDKFKSRFADFGFAFLIGAAENVRQEKLKTVYSGCQGNGEAEALTVVVSSFLLEVCRRYPEEVDSISSKLFGRLELFLQTQDGKGSTEFALVENSSGDMAILCQAVVLFARALPSSRILLLKKNITGKLSKCILEYFQSSDDSPAPGWLGPAILLFDVMAQPMVAFPNTVKEPTSGEFKEVYDAHKKQAEDLSTFARDLFNSINDNIFESNSIRKTPENPKKIEEADTEHTDKGSTVEGDQKSETKAKGGLPFQSVPPYFPLLPERVTRQCVQICARVLDSKLEFPGVVHATLLLLLRLLRNPILADDCLRSSFAEKIIGLPEKNRFVGHTGLVTLIYRRLIEDDQTLQTSMEIEIRSALLKIHRKKNSSNDNKKRPLADRKLFLQAMTPLLCRQQSTFLKAIAISVSFCEGKPGSDEGKVALLTPSERTRNVQIVSDFLARSSEANGFKSQKNVLAGKFPAKASKRRSTPKKIKRERAERKDKHDDELKTPTLRITNLLVSYVMKVAITNSGYDSRFLRDSEVLTILSELVLAVPACATHIHKFRFGKSKSMKQHSFVLRHALNGCPPPSRTFVNFLLHVSLIQNRRLGIPASLEAMDIDDEKNKMARLSAHHKAKLSQSTARLLFALVARPGEGRRRVVNDLIFALSEGLLGGSGTVSSVPKYSLKSESEQVESLRLWCEVCFGLAAPRNVGSNYDDDKALSIDVITIMLEGGMAHALLVALHRVPISHPQASLTLASILTSLEMLSRPSVSDMVHQNIKKEDTLRHRDSERASKPSHLYDKDRNEAFADDHMLEEAFAHAPQAGSAEHDNMEADFVNANEIRGVNNDGTDEQFMIAEEMDETDGADIHDDAMAVDEGMMNEEISFSEESGESSDDEDSDSDSSEEDSDEEESIIESDDSDESSHAFDAENGDEHFSAIDEEVDFADMPGDESQHAGMGEDWTRVDSNGFGGMILGNRRGMGQQNNDYNAPRGFLDAAEAMIGTLLRTGEIQGESLAELEGSLGVRLVGANGLRSQLQANSGALFTGQGATRDMAANRSERNGREGVATLPQINQRTQPDVGYSNLGDGRRWSVNTIEYVYGGPSMSAGSRNYSLAPTPIDIERDPNPSLAQIEAPLFPGGPASVVHSRARQSVHPLLCGIDLPPINSLVSDILPHGLREIGHMHNSLRSDDWSNGQPIGGRLLMSTSNGTIVRSSLASRSLNVPIGVQSENGGGLVGWSDDGLPFDASVEDFRAAFESALGEAMVTRPAGISSTEGQSRIANDMGDSAASNAQIQAESNTNPGQDEGAERPSSEATSPENEASDGEIVASSLASTLRLSPGLNPPDEGNTAEETAIESSERNAVGDRSVVDMESTDELHEDTETAVDSSQENRQVDASSVLCPPNIDEDVFNALPSDMQREVVEQARVTAAVASQLDASSSLDPEALAALPEDMRQEVIQQEQRERALEQQQPADPANAQEMDNASFVASLTPDLREEILLTADNTFLESLPANLRTEAQILRERASINHRRSNELEHITEANNSLQQQQRQQQQSVSAPSRETQESINAASAKRKQRVSGKIKVEKSRDALVYLPDHERLSPPLSKSDFTVVLNLFYLLSPVRPQRLFHKILQNIVSVERLRYLLISILVRLLHQDNQSVTSLLNEFEKVYADKRDWRAKMDARFSSDSTFPPSFLIGTAPEVMDTETVNPSLSSIRKKQLLEAAASMATNLPLTSVGSRYGHSLPAVVASRVVDALQFLCRNSHQVSVDMLIYRHNDDKSMIENSSTCFDMLLDLLEKNRYSKSSANLEQLLSLIETGVSPLSNLPKHSEDTVELSKRDIAAADSAGKTWVDVPKVTISQRRLHLLCSILRMETCKESSFAKVNTICRRLCRIDANRGCILTELASVARALASDAVRDLKALSIRMSNAIEMQQSEDIRSTDNTGRSSSSVTVATSSSEIKLLRVLQTLQSLCTDINDDVSTRKDGLCYVTDELVQLLNAMDLDILWMELSNCLHTVQILEGVKIESSETDEQDENVDEENNDRTKKLNNSVIGLLTRFLPSIESFFVATASSVRGMEHVSEDEQKSQQEFETSEGPHLVGGNRLFEFVAKNKILINALIRSNHSLLDKGLKALICVPRCRSVLDFDVKRHWFKAQVRRLRQQANRRHGSLRLHIRRENVLIDAYHQLRLRNADEMRGRLHITFRDEQGVDAGGLSREFFGLLAKEMFNPNYALFTSTEDGSTFQPNPNSSINPDHLSYFRFVGRIIGKAVLDGYLLDAHFTRSLYKHMLGIVPTHDDMEAIDPDYYKNLKTILEYNLDDLGLELKFTVEDHSFGRYRMLDLIPNGRDISVTEENKAKYVRLICQHRMTTSIKSQINAYLDGFYELVNRDLITVFTPRELELLISGLPDIDVHDLKQNTEYVGWKPADEQILWFWNVLHSFSRNQKASFLQFVTGSSKVPLGGFAELPGMRGVQKFSIHKTSGPAGALISAHTCFNSIDLPKYEGEDELKEKLLYAITEGSGGFRLA